MEKSSTDDQLMNLEVLHPNAAGIGIGNAVHYVAVSPDRDITRGERKNAQVRSELTVPIKEQIRILT